MAGAELPPGGLLDLTANRRPAEFFDPLSADTFRLAAKRALVISRACYRAC
jgi:hypothetical protein